MTVAANVMLGNERSQAVRQLQAAHRQASVLALHISGFNRSEIAKKLDVSVRTIIRDLAEIDDQRVRVTEILEDSPINAMDIHIRLTEILDADFADIIDEVTNSFKPLHSWPRVWRQMLTESDVRELFERSKDDGGSSWDKIGEVIKIKKVDYLKAIELAGRLKTVDAFVRQNGNDAGEIAGEVMNEIDKRIAAGRQRAARVIDVPAIMEGK